MLARRLQSSGLTAGEVPRGCRSRFPIRSRERDGACRRRNCRRGCYRKLLRPTGVLCRILRWVNWLFALPRRRDSERALARPSGQHCIALRRFCSCSICISRPFVAAGRERRRQSVNAQVSSVFGRMRLGSGCQHQDLLDVILVSFCRVPGGKRLAVKHEALVRTLDDCLDAENRERPRSRRRGSA